MDIIKTIESFKRKRFTNETSAELIKDAERELGLTISEEYKCLIQKYGFLSVKGEEFLGIDGNSYDLVKATKEARMNDRSFPNDAYVIENMAIDGILLLQKSSSELFTYQPNSPLQTVSPSLNDYLKDL